MSPRRALLVPAAALVAFACGGPADPEVGGPGGGAGASATGSGGSGMPSGASSGAGGATSGSGGSTPSAPVDCSGITSAGFTLCSSSQTECTAVFTGSQGCAAVCAAAGLTCSAVFENAADGCAADMSRPALSCSGTGHESDYCVCVGSGSSGGSGSGSGSGSGGGGSGNGGTGGGGSAGTGNTGANATTCTSITDFGTVNSTIVVGSGETYDGGCKRFIAGSSLGDGSQEEGQDPVFVLEDGATLKNVVLGFPAADGIHTEGDANLSNVHWEDIGEDALTVEGSGTVVIDGGSAYKGSDKVFQLNAPCTFRLSNFIADGAGKLIRQNGNTTFEVNVFIDKCDISNMNESIFRTDSDSSTVSMTNTRYSNIGDALFLGVAPGNVTQSNNTEY